MSSHLKEAPYYNCLIVDPDGKRLGFCDRKKELSYLRKGLAVVVSGYETKAIKLNFRPNWGNRPLLEEDLIPRDNICVVCGTSVGLTRHHIVPSCYRCHLPLHLKDHNPYDIVAICTDDHNSYEKKAEEFKRELAIEFGVVSPFSQNEEFLLRKNAISAANVLLNNSDKLPENRKIALKNKVDIFLGKEAGHFDLVQLSNSSTIGNKERFTHGVELVNKLHGIDEFNRFIIRWRMHFVKFAKPKFLPKGWAVDRRFADFQEIVEKRV